jgi:hypothetical protein
MSRTFKNRHAPKPKDRNEKRDKERKESKSCKKGGRKHG